MVREEIECYFDEKDVEKRLATHEIQTQSKYHGEEKKIIDR